MIFESACSVPSPERGLPRSGRSAVRTPGKDTAGSDSDTTRTNPVPRLPA